MADKNKSSDEISIFILIDALGWTYIKDRSFLEEMATQKKPIKSVLGFSSAAIPSILTGRRPDEHGHWSLFYRAEKASPFRWSRPLGPLIKLAPERVARKGIEEISKMVFGYKGYFETYIIPLEELPNYDISEKRNIYAPCGIEGSRTIFDLWEEAGLSYLSLSYWNGKDKEIFDKAEIALKKGDLRALFLYLPEFDAYLHRGCKDDSGVSAQIKDYERSVKKLVETANGSYKEVRWFVFSDHGMAPINKSVDLMAEIRKAGLKEGKDYNAFYDSTMARLWFKNDEAREKITERLASLDCGRWLPDDEMRSLGVFFEDRRYGEAVFLMDEGTVIAPSYMGHTAPDGMHGFHPDFEYSDAVFITNTKDSYNPKTITDYFSVMKEDTLGEEGKKR